MICLHLNRHLYCYQVQYQTSSSTNPFVVKAKIRMAKMSIGFLRRLGAITTTSPPAAQDWTVGRTPEEEAANRSGGEDEINAELREELTILQDKIEKLRSAECVNCEVSLGDNLVFVGL